VLRPLSGAINTHQIYKKTNVNLTTSKNVFSQYKEYEYGKAEYSIDVGPET